MPKIRQSRRWGYFVIEWPVSRRGELASKAALQEMGRRITGAFKALGFDRGIRRWHFFGDLGGKYNPHLNILVPTGYIYKGKLGEVKRYLKEVLDCPDIIVHYGYRVGRRKVLHTVKYVCRATFRDYTWDENLARDLYGFRNMWWWGRWDNDDVWGDEEMDECELPKVCPICGKPIKWKGVVSAEEVASAGAVEVSPDLWVRDRSRPPGVDPPQLPSVRRASEAFERDLMRSFCDPETAYREYCRYNRIRPLWRDIQSIRDGWIVNMLWRD
jgi:hypothetical protein